MDLIALKGYLRSRRTVPLQDMAFHFHTDIETIRPLLAVWIGKGKVRRLPGGTAPCKGCCQCDPAAIEVYEWLE